MKRGIEHKRNRNGSFVEVWYQSNLRRLSRAGFCVVFSVLVVCACIGNSFALSINETHGWVNSHGIGFVPPANTLAQPKDGRSFHYYDKVNAETPHSIASRVDFTGGYYAEAFSSTKLQENHVYAYASFPTTPIGGYSISSAKSMWVDQINPYPAAPLGTLVPWNWYIYSYGTHSMPDWEMGNSYVTETVVNLRASDGYNFSYNLSLDTRNGTLGMGGVWYGGTLMVPAQHILTYSVSTESIASVAYNATISRSAFADYRNSVYFYVDSSPGSNSIALSGHDYARPVAAVPEPSTLSLIVSCLSGLGAAVFTRRRP